VTYATLTASLVGSSSTSEADILAAIEKKTKIADADRQRLVEGLKWIGLFSQETVPKKDTPLDSLCASLEAKMQFNPGERDLVFLQHRFEVENADGSKEVRTSTLADMGAPEAYGSQGDASKSSGYSSMAKLVGVPCGVAVKYVLGGKINTPGVLAPMNLPIALQNELMKDLKDDYGIFLTEKTL
jgi:saccharopine dehydrogenase (NADP+, L-glutamate forming)